VRQPSSRGVRPHANTSIGRDNSDEDCVKITA